LADIFRLHGPAYRARFQERLPPSHWRVMEAIENCRTEAAGGQVYHWCFRHQLLVELV
jgi:hypothetical protein